MQGSGQTQRGIAKTDCFVVGVEQRGQSCSGLCTCRCNMNSRGCVKKCETTAVRCSAHGRLIIFRDQRTLNLMCCPRPTQQCWARSFRCPRLPFSRRPSSSFGSVRECWKVSFQRPSLDAGRASVCSSVGVLGGERLRARCPGISIPRLPAAEAH